MFDRMYLSDREYASLSAQDAREHFRWFLGHIDQEIDALGDRLEGRVDLNFTPESLVPLDGCFKSMLVYQKRSPKAILRELRGAHPLIIAEMLEKRYVPTPMSVDIGIRVGLYLGEVFVRNDADLHWDYVRTPKNSIDLHVPTVFGFSPPTMTFQAHANAIGICLPVASATDTYTGIRTLHEWYAHWMEEKRVFWDPRFDPRIYMDNLYHRAIHRDA